MQVGFHRGASTDIYESAVRVSDMAQKKSWGIAEQLFVVFCKEHGLSVSFTSGPDSSPTIKKIRAHVYEIARRARIGARKSSDSEEMFEDHELLMWDFIDIKNRLLFEVKNPKTSRMARQLRAHSSKYLTKIQEWRARMFDKRGWLCYLVLLQDPIDSSQRKNNYGHRGIPTNLIMMNSAV